MNSNNNYYEYYAKNVINNIYPYLINDLEIYCPFPIENKIILEIGTGPGYVLKALSKKKFSKILGIDKSLDMLLRAKQLNNHADQLTLCCSKAEKIPFKTAYVDIVISRGSMFFWDDIEASFMEIYRVLKPNGFAMLGGGYGLSTPESLITEISNYQENHKHRSLKPKIDIEKCLDIMRNIGGKAGIESKKGHGFWLIWNK